MAKKAKPALAKASGASKASKSAALKAAPSKSAKTAKLTKVPATKKTVPKTTSSKFESGKSEKVGIPLRKSSPKKMEKVTVETASKMGKTAVIAKSTGAKAVESTAAKSLDASEATGDQGRQGLRVVEAVPTKAKAAAVAPERVETATVEEAETDKAATDKADKKGKKSSKDEIKVDRNGNLEAQWSLLHDRSKGIKPAPYQMSDNYEARTPLFHKVLGWGYVLSSQNNRLEVLFKDGIKVLIANYKGVERP